MPSPLLHVHGAAELWDSGALPDSVASAVRDAPWSFRLGAVLVDLPMYDRFWLKVALFLAGRPYPPARWSEVLHARGAGALSKALLRRADGIHRAEIVAVVAGLLTHVALDREMHPAVEDAVGLHLRPDETWAQLHEAVENYQSLVWHRRRYHSDGLGTPLVRRALSVAPGRGGRLPPWLAGTVRSALEDVYATAPTKAALDAWSEGLCGYRDLLGGPAARLSVRSSERFGRERPWVARLDLEDAYGRGLATARRYLAAAAKDSPEELAREVGDGPLV